MSVVSTSTSRGSTRPPAAGYTASDPDLLLWIHAVEVHSFVAAYRAYAGRLDDDDADRYVAEMVRVAELVELPVGMAPRSMGELREYLQSVEGLQVTPAAREGMRMIFFPPMPLALRPLWAIPATATLAILPRVARRLYGLPWPAPVTLPVRANVFALTRVMNTLLPASPIIRRAGPSPGRGGRLSVPRDASAGPGTRLGVGPAT